MDVLHYTPPHPTRLLPLLANHHTTLLYLGHSNVLLLSPLADALCSNLRKIGWEEEKSEESGRREGVVTGARSSLPSKKNPTSSFVIFLPYSICLCRLLLVASPSILIYLPVKCLCVPQLPREPRSTIGAFRFPSLLFTS